MSELLNLPPGTMIGRGKWRVKKKLGQGGCGIVYLVDELGASGQQAAMKIEPFHKCPEDEILKMEAHVMGRVKSKHMCEMLTSGKTADFNFIIMSLLGYNLAELRRLAPRHKFTRRTSLEMANQCLVAVRDLHVAGFIHRDIKPSNFALGAFEGQRRTVFLFDFGLAREYRPIGGGGSGKWRPPRKDVAFRGTVRYCSVNVHRRREQAPHDDIWSLFYMIIEMMVGQLPWDDCVNQRDIRPLKENISDDKLLVGCPREFQLILTHLKKLQYGTMPNYKLIGDQLNRALKKERCWPSDPYDWEKGSPLFDKFWLKTKKQDSAETKADVSDLQ